jgi:hypothetical protein
LVAGIGWLIAGIIFIGLGVVPVAFIALAVHGQWGIMGEQTLTLIVIFAFRSLGLYLMTKTKSVQGVSIN